MTLAALPDLHEVGRHIDTPAAERAAADLLAALGAHELLTPQIQALIAGGGPVDERRLADPDVPLEHAATGEVAS